MEVKKMKAPMQYRDGGAEASSVLSLPPTDKQKKVSLVGGAPGTLFSGTSRSRLHPTLFPMSRNSLNSLSQNKYKKKGKRQMNAMNANAHKSKQTVK